MQKLKPKLNRLSMDGKDKEGKPFLTMHKNFDMYNEKNIKWSNCYYYIAIVYCIYIISMLEDTVIGSIWIKTWNDKWTLKKK